MPDLGFDRLGPFPLLQLVAAVVILVGLAAAVYRGTRDRRLSADQEPIAGRNRWYFDGPLNAALETMHDQYKVLCSIDHSVETFGEQFRTHTRLLEEIKSDIHDIKNTKDRRR
jgi:hypothetical protein